MSTTLTSLLMLSERSSDNILSKKKQQQQQEYLKQTKRKQKLFKGGREPRPMSSVRMATLRSIAASLRDDEGPAEDTDSIRPSTNTLPEVPTQLHERSFHQQENSEVLTEALRALQKKINGLENERLFLQHTNTTLQRECDDLREMHKRELAALRKTHEETLQRNEAEAAGLRDEIAALRAELEERVALQHALSVQLSQAQRSAAAAQERVESQGSQTGAEIKSLHSVIKRLNTRAEEAEAASSKLQQELAKLRQERAKLLQYVESARAERDEAIDAARKVVGTIGDGVPDSFSVQVAPSKRLKGRKKKKNQTVEEFDKESTVTTGGGGGGGAKKGKSNTATTITTTTSQSSRQKQSQRQQYRLMKADYGMQLMPVRPHRSASAGPSSSYKEGNLSFPSTTSHYDTKSQGGYSTSMDSLPPTKFKSSGSPRAVGKNNSCAPGTKSGSRGGYMVTASVNEQDVMKLVRSLNDDLEALRNEYSMLINFARNDPVAFARSPGAQARVAQLKTEVARKQRQITMAASLG